MTTGDRQCLNVHWLVTDEDLSKEGSEVSGRYLVWPAYMQPCLHVSTDSGTIM